MSRLRDSVGFASLCVVPVLLIAFSSVAPVAAQEWVEFQDDTALRLDQGPEGIDMVDDGNEKAFAYGDVDQDGDLDLVCVRKEPFTSAGKRTNVLWMNEGIADGQAINGVLVDRTAEYAVASDIAGDEGFLTPTNDRDVLLVDVDNDGWLDMVTAVTISFGDEKHISHPRIYMNLGDDIDGNWLGFEYQDARFPQVMVGTTPNEPCFCSVAAGDVDSDGDLDLYFGEYDSACFVGPDVDDKFYLNDGTGYFTDATEDNFEGEITVFGTDYPFYQSAFGTAVAIRDLNGDGLLDILKDTALNPPQYVGISFNNSTDEGVYDDYESIYTLAPYFASVGDLNNDDMLDIVITDDGPDQFMLNEGNGTDGHPNWDQKSFSFSPSGFDDGFGGTSYIEDLNNDGFKDVVITDVDIDISGCGRRVHIYRNLGDVPSVTLQEQNGSQDWTPSGVHDTAIFDINGDGWLDMVHGLCTGTEVWINDPPVGMLFTYPQGLAAFLTPDEETTLQFSVAGVDAGIPAAGSARFYYSVDSGPFTETIPSEVSANLYEAVIPAFECATKVRYYVTAELENGGTFADPASAPATYYSAVAASGTEITVDEGFEDGVAGWTASTVTFGGSTSGAWELVDPNGTNYLGGVAAPEEDAGQGTQETECWVTDNGAVGELAGVSDVDNMTAILTSPVFNLANGDASMTWSWWFASYIGTADTLYAELTSDGVTWVTAASLDMPAAPEVPTWQIASILVSDFVTPSATVQIRFTVTDYPSDSVTEAGVDNFQLAELLCDGATPGEPLFERGDVNASGNHDISDPIFLLDYMFGGGTTIGCEKSGDLDDDGSLGLADAVQILSYLFNDGADPASPFGSCGTDPTADSLSCASFPACP